MSYKSDIEIAREAQKKPIQEIGAKLPFTRIAPHGTSHVQRLFRERFQVLVV